MTKDQFILVIKHAKLTCKVKSTLLQQVRIQMPIEAEDLELSSFVLRLPYANAKLYKL